jgi:mono/diheme cytochrome c family protein
MDLPLLRISLSCLLVLATGSPALAGQGETLYEATCGTCHGLDGAGAVAPPLVGADPWVRLGDKAGAFFTGVTAAGFSGTITVGNETFSNQSMPAQLAPSAEDMVQIAYYVLVELNGLSMDDVPSARDFAAARDNPPSIAQLIALREIGR